MPGGDRTGPMGYGSMTGRGAGFCAGHSVPSFANPLSGREFVRGRGMGRGGGWGHRNWFCATVPAGWQRAAYAYSPYVGFTPYAMHFAAASCPPYAPALSKKEELNELKYQAEYLKDSLESVKKRIAELEKESIE